MHNNINSSKYLILEKLKSIVAVMDVYHIPTEFQPLNRIALLCLTARKIYTFK
jgi:hypothetical protein